MRARQISETIYNPNPKRYGFGVDPWFTFVQLAPYMVDEARQAAHEQSKSYRGFKVGASLLAISAEQTRIGVFVGANTKREGAPKICAEQKVLRLAKAQGYDRAIALLVAGTTEVQLIEEVTGRSTPTLHPCGECRSFFTKNGLMKPDTALMTVGKDEDKFQLFTLEELGLFYKAGHDEAQEMPPAHHFDDPDFGGWFASRALYSFMVNNPEEPQVATLGFENQVEMFRSTLSNRTQ